MSLQFNNYFNMQIYPVLLQSMASISHFILSLIPFILFIIFLYKWRYSYNRTSSKPGKNLPPSPAKLPLIGNLHQLGVLPHRSLQSLSIRYGPLMLLHLGKVPVIVASSADAAREIMKNQDLIFASRPKLKVPDKLLYGSKDVVFAPYDDYWRQMRSICVLQLLGTKRVQSFRRVREEETSIMIEKIREMGRLSAENAVNLSDALISVTNDVVCRAALGRKYGDGGEGKRLKNLLKEFNELLGTSSLSDYIPWLGWMDRINGLEGKLERVAKAFDEFLEGVLKDHRDDDQKREGLVLGDGGELDFVDVLLEFQRANKDTSPIEDDAIKAIVLDMFGAGTDTTYTALEWTISELLRHPKTLEKLQNEVRELAAGKEEITESDLEKMHYLKAVIKESLRLHSPVPLLVPRELTKDTNLMGYDIAAGTQVITNCWAIGQDPSLWENPQDFYPERFSDASIDFRGLHFKLIPFGSGRRGCPGVAFAMAVGELALAKLVHKFDLKLCMHDGTKEKVLDMTEVNGGTVHKKFPLLVVATTPK